ncbi:MAG: Y-family DNA polymerase [Pseudohongiellaceae bacterium]
MLWIALSLPELPLQLAQRSESAPTQPRVISEGPEIRPLVCCANAPAQERGVVPGMPVAAARALAGELGVLPRDVGAEAQALHNLACWAGQFTPNVTLHAASLLLEVESTLQLHGGLAALLARVRKGVAQLGYTTVPGVAPTPLAAWLLAQARQAGLAVRMCRDPQQLPERLSALPLALFEWPADTLQTLQALGIRRIGQCLALPRDGFIRRFGHGPRLDLDKALGLVPDPRRWFTPPERFASRLEFGFELNDAQALLFPLKRLLREFEGFLRSRGAGVQQWQLLLEHWNHGCTQLAIGTSLPERSSDRLLALARERLLQLTLQAPVLALGIAAQQLHVFAEHSQSLVADTRSRALGWSQLVDRLQARLGSDRLYGLRSVDDVRPERSWQRCPVLPAASRSGACPGTAPRPLWLLEPPRALSSQQDQPLCQGQLQLLAGPERIEAGWWDGRPACRDYYVARNARGETLWIYREHRREPHWYLHGIFA